MMFHALPDGVRHLPSPPRFTYPFCYEPHPLCVAVADEVRTYLNTRPEWHDELSRGKMLGVLVVEKEGERGFLAAFSGTLDGATRHAYFVPPVFDCMAPGCHFQLEQERISALNRSIERLQEEAGQPLQPALAQAELARVREEMRLAKARRDELRATLPAEELQCREPEFIRESQFRKAEYKRLQKMWQERIDAETAASAHFYNEIKALEQERKERSRALQDWLFRQYDFLNARGEHCLLPDIFAPLRPPGGAGDCCAPKLLQAAYLSGFRPLCMGEFWVGASPADELRTEGRFYPSCRSKCLPILTHMLVGLEVDANPLAAQQNDLMQQVCEVFRNADFVVLNKPGGLLSVPGKDALPSLRDYVREHYPEATGPLIVHRLDMDTSGLMVVALHEAAYHRLQHLFLQQRVEKTYLALLEKPMPVGESGSIELPLLPDIYDRPRQKVDRKHGRAALTHYRVLAEVDGHALLALTPHTGRTHQLRVHCAHRDGLDNPIVGDRLYGRPAMRLMLHAARLAFDGHEFTDYLGLGNYNITEI